MAGAILALDDDVRRPESFVEAALLDGDRLEHGGRLPRIEDRRRFAIVDLHVGGEEPLAIFVREQQNRLGHVADLALGEARLIVVYERDDVPARDVPEIHDREAGRVEVQADAAISPAGIVERIVRA